LHQPVESKYSDAYFQSEIDNLELVKQAAHKIQKQGYEIGTAPQLRQHLSRL